MRDSVILLTLFILITNHFYSYSQQSNPTWLHYVYPEFVTDITEDNTNIWVGTYKAGIVKINKSTGEETYLNMMTSDIPFNEVLSLHIASNGNLYVGGNCSFATYDGSLWTKYDTQNSNIGNIGFARDICEDQDGNIWFGSNFEGILKFDGSTFTKYYTHLSISTLCIDTNNIIWFSTGSSSGVSSINTSGVHINTFASNYGCVPSSYIPSVITDKQNRIWACSNQSSTGTNGGLCYIINDSCYTIQDTSYETFAYCTDMDIDSSGDIYIATLDRGIIKYDGNISYVINFDSLGIPFTPISRIYFDNDDNIWFSNNKGSLYKYHNSVIDSFNINLYNLASNNYTSVLIGSDNKKHLQFTKHPYDYKQYARYVIINNDTTVYNSQGLFYDYFENTDGHLWVGTTGGLLEIYDTNEIFYPYPSTFGFYIQTSNKICKGANNTIWVGTNYGLFTFDGQTWSSMFPIPNTDYGVNALYYDNNTDMLYASFSDFKGVYKYNNNQWSAVPLAIITNEIFDIFADKTGQIWVFSEYDGFAKLDPITNNETTHPISNATNIVASCVSNSNTIYACSRRALYIYDGQVWDTLNINTSEYPYIDPNDIEADQYGNIWIVGKNGIAIYNEQGIVLNLNELLNSNNEDEYFHIYPNPSNGNITLLTDENYKDIKLKLYSSDGKQVFSKELESSQNNNIKLNTATLNSGVYILNIVTESTTVSKKIIIQN